MTSTKVTIKQTDLGWILQSGESRSEFRTAAEALAAAKQTAEEFVSSGGAGVLVTVIEWTTVDRIGAVVVAALQ